MSWESIVNQEQVKEILKGILVRKRLAHAYVFSGHDGVGKDAIAIELAKIVNCERSYVDACDACASCHRVSTLQHPNVQLVFPLPVGKGEKDGDSPLAKLSDDEVKLVQEQIQTKSKNLYHAISLPKANMIKINSIREIRRDASMMAFGKGKKVFILLDAENMSDASANALLKTLEEPPGNTLMILTTTYPDKLLPTILSRCQHIRFGALKKEDIQQALIQREHCAEDEAWLIAELASGSYGRALELINSDLRKHRDQAIDFLRTMLRGSQSEILAIIDQLSSGSEKQEIEELLLLLQTWIRDAFIHQHDGRDEAALTKEESLLKFAAHYRHVDLSRAIRAIEKTISLVNKNVYIPLVLTTLALTLRNIFLPSPDSKRVLRTSYTG